LDLDISGSLGKYKIPRNCGFPLANLQNGSSVDFVPEENVGENLDQLCIREGNLKYLEGKIVDANLIKHMPKFITMIAELYIL
jgi:hypothetical protein